VNPDALKSAEPGGASAPPDTPDVPIEDMPPSGPPVLGFRRSTDPPSATGLSSVPPEMEVPIRNAPATMPSDPPSDAIHDPPSNPHAADDGGWAEEPPSVTVLDPQPEPRPTVTPSVTVEGNQTLADALVDLGSGAEEESSPDVSVEEATVFKGPLLGPENARIFEGSSGPVDTKFPKAVLETATDASSPSREHSGPILRVGLEAALERLGVTPGDALEFGEKPLAIVQASHSILVAKVWPSETLPARNALIDLLLVMDPVYESAELIGAPWGNLCRILVIEIGKKNGELRKELEQKLPPLQPSVPPPAPPAPSVSRPPPLPPSKRRGQPPPLPPSRGGPAKKRKEK
jgi:hypothetical protein